MGRRYSLNFILSAKTHPKFCNTIIIEFLFHHYYLGPPCQPAVLATERYISYGRTERYFIEAARASKHYIDPKEFCSGILD